LNKLNSSVITFYAQNKLIDFRFQLAISVIVTSI